MIIKPELLTHPNIPKPLHGTAPRTLLGKEWWDVKRQEAYRKNNYHCMACGQHKSQDRFHNWLEAHEDYTIDYKSGSVKLNRIVALCHTCHNFIHSGRLGILYKNGDITKDKALYVLSRGFHILKQNNLEPFWGAAEVYAEITDRLDLLDRVDDLRNKQSKVIQQDWSKWHIEIDGVKHFGKFKSLREWQNYYD